MNVQCEKEKYTGKYILGIESSCDDTGIALICDNEILANVVLKQEHKNGVIPEYAARAHHIALFEHARDIIKDCKIDLIAYTSRPGLIGSLFVGANFAKSLAYMLDVPSIGINHLTGHILLPYWLASSSKQKIEFPYLCLLVSGGHTMIVLVKSLIERTILSSTFDDAVGEVFDKVARNIGLDYPGGPHIEKLASQASGEQRHFPKYHFPFVMRNRLEFSFSGLKTAAIEQIDITANQEEKAQFCHAFQAHIAMLLADKMKRIYSKHTDVAHWVVSGGVAANKTIRQELRKEAEVRNITIHYPPIELCMDNGVMIACVGQLFYQQALDQSVEAMLSHKPSAQMGACVMHFNALFYALLEMYFYA